MTVSKKMITASSVALGLLTTNLVQVDALVWTPRTVEQVRASLQKESGQVTYTIQYGDTLSTIAEALSVDLELLAKLNNISNWDLIFPQTVLTTQVDQAQEVTALTIQAPANDSDLASVSATVDLQTNQVTVADQVINLEQVAASSDSHEVVEATHPVLDDSAQPLAQPEEASVHEVVLDQVAVEEPAAPVAEDTWNDVSGSEVVATEAPAVSPAEDTQNDAPAFEVEVPEVAEFEPDGEQPLVEGVVASGDLMAEAAAPEVVEELPLAPQPEVQVSAPSPSVATVTTFTGSEAGLLPHVVAYKHEVLSVFGNMWVNGYRPDTGDHGKGLALDFMVPESSALGDQIAAYAAANMANKKISYIIWKQRFYAPFESKYGPAYTWNLMEDRGSVTENHYDHVHVSFEP